MEWAFLLILRVAGTAIASLEAEECPLTSWLAQK